MLEKTKGTMDARMTSNLGGVGPLECCRAGRWRNIKKSLRALGRDRNIRLSLFDLSLYIPDRSSYNTGRRKDGVL